MADTPTGETANPGDSKTDGQPTAAPAANAVDPAELERIRKEAEQAKMRANQLQNQIDEAKKAEEARKAKELEEQNEFKSLYEQSQARLKEIEEAQERENRQKELDSGTQEVLGQFSQEVVEIAKEAGIALNDTTDEAKAQLKEKLEKIQSKVVKESSNTPNNPNTSTTVSQDQIYEQMRYGDPKTRQSAKSQAINSLEAVKQMKQMAGYRDQ